MDIKIRTKTKLRAFNDKENISLSLLGSTREENISLSFVFVQRCISYSFNLYAESARKFNGMGRLTHVF